MMIFIAGCTSTPKEKQSTKSSLNSEEIKEYQAALNNMQTGEFDKAVTELNKFTQAHPTHIGAIINLATALYKNKKVADSNRVLDTAKKINPNLAEIYNLSGLLDVEKGEYNSAEKNYLAAIKIKKDYAAAHYNLALVYDIFYQDFNQAIAQYEQYLNLTGNSDKETITWVEELKLKQKRKG